MISLTCNKEAMKVVVNIRMDEKLKRAMEQLAKKQHTSFSALARLAMIRFLEDHNIDWREEESKE
jgi:predicted transcriptional regulator